MVTWHVSVDDGTTRSLWAATELRGAGGVTDGDEKGQYCARVPRLRIHGVSWRLSAVFLPQRRTTSPSSLDGLVWSNDNVPPYRRVTWASGLKKMEFGSRLNKALDILLCPIALQKLIFGEDFDQRHVAGVTASENVRM